MLKAKISSQEKVDCWQMIKLKYKHWYTEFSLVEIWVTLPAEKSLSNISGHHKQDEFIIMAYNSGYYL